MTTEIKLGDKTLTLLSNASTVYRFKQAFGIDLIKVLFNVSKTPISDAESMDLAVKLAYVMSHQASGEGLDKLGEEDFIQWLDGYDVLELETADAGIKIWDAYTGQTHGDSTAKKKNARQSAK